MKLSYSIPIGVEYESDDVEGYVSVENNLVYGYVNVNTNIKTEYTFVSKTFSVSIEDGVAFIKLNGYQCIKNASRPDHFYQTLEIDLN